MMATTHGLAGLLLGSLTLLVAPELAPIAMLAGLAGGIFPDLDLYGAHRKTLHFPVYYTLAGLVALGVALAVTMPSTVAIAVFLLAAALHSLTDMFGGGLELRPWQGTSERAVYSHYHGRWLTPRRWVGYDGAPGDLALATAFALPLLVFVDWHLVAPLVTGAIAVSGVYTLVRKRLADLAEDTAAFVPAPVRPYVPERYL
jgi:hypothetical protein